MYKQGTEKYLNLVMSKTNKKQIYNMCSMLYWVKSAKLKVEKRSLPLPTNVFFVL